MKEIIFITSFELGKFPQVVSKGGERLPWSLSTEMKDRHEFPSYPDAVAALPEIKRVIAEFIENGTRHNSTPQSCPELQIQKTWA